MRSLKITLLSLLMLPLLLPATFAATDMPTSFSEGFESGTSGWRYTHDTEGADRDCTVAHNGTCSLRLQPPCCYGILQNPSRWTIYERPMDIGLANRDTQIDFYFRGNQTRGNNDAMLSIRTDLDRVDFSWTGALYANWDDAPANWTQIRSFETDREQTSECGAWDVPGAWYHVKIYYDAVTTRALAYFREPDGTYIGSCAAFMLGSKIEAIEIRGYDLDTDAEYHIDDIAITQTRVVYP